MKISHLILVLLFCISIGYALDPSQPEIKTRIVSGIELTILNKFGQAENIYRDILDEYPEEPLGYMYLAAVIQSQMLDRENFDRKTEFEELITECIEKSKILQKKRGSDPWLLFFEGSAYLYRSFMQSKMKNIWSAYRSALKGADRLDKVIKMDSTFFDAYLGIGSFKYWKSSKTKFVRWIPFIPDEREKGIRMVKKAVENGEFVRLIGRDQLAWILLDSGRMEEALQNAIQNNKLYPDSRFFKWTLVKIYDKGGYYDSAYSLYSVLLKEFQNIPQNNHYNEIGCLLRMAEIDFDRGNYVKTDSLTSNILNIKLDPAVKDRVRSKLKESLKLKQKCSEFFNYDSLKAEKTVLEIKTY